MKKESVISNSPEETAGIAKKFVENLLKTLWKKRGEAVIILMEGNLGSGKTTFVQAVAKTLGINNTVTSPTFVLEKIYTIPNKNKKEIDFRHLIHIDAYRLSNKEDLESIGWEAIQKDPENIIFIEWPERVEGAFSEKTQKIKFEFVDETTRRLNFYCEKTLLV